MHLHGCAIASALKQTFAQCKFFLKGTLFPIIRIFATMAFSISENFGSNSEGYSLFFFQ